MLRYEWKEKYSIFLYIAFYWCGFLFSRLGFRVISAIMLISIALFLYIISFRNTHNFINLEGIFSLSWVGGQGIACLQLSQIQREWAWVTWLCFFLAYLGFWCGRYWSGSDILKKNDKKRNYQGQEKIENKVLICVMVLSCVSLCAFLIEVVLVGYVPLFVDFAHAYSFFHISGVHYFTVSCALIPALSVIYFFLGPKEKKQLLLIGLCNIVMLSICVLSVSRFQLIFGVGLAIIEYFLCCKKICWKVLIIVGIIVVGIYGILSIYRNHDVSYLNDIFEMKNQNTPIAITQPYMYIVNNYENFDCLVKQLPDFTYGLQMLFPVFALTGLKFVFPELEGFADYVTKPELNTYTMFYDSYYDFGCVGVFLLALLLGVLTRWLTIKVNELDIISKNPMILFFYGQVAMYCALSFFTTWFSLPTTWFWFILTFLMYVFVNKVNGLKEMIKKESVDD